MGNGDIRTVASGVVKWIPQDQMLNAMVIVLCNLKGRKMGDFESNAMVLAGEDVDGNACELLCPPEGSAVGDLITFEGEGRSPPEGVINSKKFEKVSPNMKINGDGVAVWKDIPFATDKGTCTVKNIRNGIVK